MYLVKFTRKILVEVDVKQEIQQNIIKGFALSTKPGGLRFSEEMNV